MIEVRLLIICLITAVCPIVRGANIDTRSDSIDILHTDLSIDVSDFSSRVLYGRASITFEAKVNGINYIKLDLLGLKIDSIRSADTSLDYTYDDSVIAVTLPSSLMSGQRQTITIAYHGTPDSMIVNPDATKTWYWTMPDPIPSYLASMSVSDYIVLRDSYQGIRKTIPIYLAARASDTANLKKSFVHLKTALSIFEKRFGPYQFNRVGYCLVPFTSGAMEHATNISYMKGL
ncbi:unnamed protein product [Sphagnum balticum]